VIYLLYTVHIIVCIFLILVVLLQQGKGADLSVFGGGSTQAAFGARGATTLLHKLTVISFVVFILTTLLIGIPQARRGTVMSDVPAASGGSPASTPAPAVPGTSGTPATPAPTPQGSQQPR
jgi:preprotein translocase subunit SecG